MNPFRCVLLTAALALAATLAAAPRPAVLPLPAGDGRTVPESVMAKIREQVATTFKYGVVLKGEENELVDGPKVFRHGDAWYMIYVSFRNKVGYETCLARSADLLSWEKLGRILPFREGGWDSWQANGAPALVDYEWNGTHAFTPHEGKYWMTYVGGALKGYETDPLSIGLASADSPVRAAAWTRRPEPILSSAQEDAREFENVTLYTSTVLRVDPALLGYPFVIFYNGKTKAASHEAIGMAVSHDLVNWTRLGAEPVVDNLPGKPVISGNPQIVKIGEVWVMFYFGFRWRPGAFNTFACSYDLVHWNRWEGPALVTPSEGYDQQFAHKPWVLQHDGVVYHFYCAVGNQGRVIALATSKDLRRAETQSQREN